MAEDKSTTVKKSHWCTFEGTLLKKEKNKTKPENKVARNQSGDSSHTGSIYSILGQFLGFVISGFRVKKMQSCQSRAGS